MPNLNAAFSALSDPTRRAIVARLAAGDATVNELAQPFDLSLPGISKHLKVLREVGLVDARNHGRQRLYRLNGKPLKPIHDWVKNYERAWNERFDALDAVLG